MAVKKWVWKETAETLGVLGVIASLIFVAFEVRQNNEALSLQARLERENVLREARSKRLENPDLARAVVSARAGEVLNAEETFLLDEINLATFTNFSLIYGQLRDGLLEDAAIPLAPWRDSYHEHDPRMAESWSEHKEIFSPDFVRWFEENVIQAGPLE